MKIFILTLLASVITFGAVLAHFNPNEAQERAASAVTTAPSEEIKPDCPSLTRARNWAKRRSGVSFALYCGDEISGWGKRRLSYSASTGKALLLLSFLRRGRQVRANRSDLSSMIRYSDNDAASRIYYKLGDGPLRRTARKIGLRRVQFCGCWASIRWSPADYSRLFMSLPDSVPKKYRKFAMGLLKSIVSYQRWGIPQGMGKRWKIFFKGGWRPEGYGWIVLQGALLRKGDQRMSLAVFTSGVSGVEEGSRKIKRVTRLIFNP